jgi:hypothetical protein
MSEEVKLYTVEVTELVATRRIYTVEAWSPEEAEEKAAIGDTVDEEDVKCDGVFSRQVESEPEEISQ